MKDHDKIKHAVKCALDNHGFSYVCYEEAEGLHYCQKPVTYTPKLSQDQLDAGYMPVSERRYAVVRFSNEDVDNGNLHFFLERGYTR